MRVLTLLFMSISFTLTLGTQALPQTNSSSPSPVPKTNAMIERALSNHQFSLAVGDHSLAGPGAVWLESAAAKADFTFIGEVHGVAEVPSFVKTFFHDLQPFGYGHIALEIGPWAGQNLDRYARDGDPAALQAYIGSTFEGLPLTSREELQFVTQLHRTTRQSDLVWGIDQEERAALILLQLSRIAPNSIAKSQALAAARKVTSLETDAAARHTVFTISGLLPDFASLRKSFRPSPGSTADWLLSDLAISDRLYEGQLHPMEWLASNSDRELFMKRTFMRNYRAAQAAGERHPKVVLVVGSGHGYRGLNDLRVSTLANFLAEFAITNNGSLFNLIVICGQGGKQMGVQDDYGKDVACDASTDTSTTYMAPFANTARGRWTIYDLKAIRPLLYSGAMDSPSRDFSSLVFQYDALLWIKNTTAEHPR